MTWIIFVMTHAHIVLASTEADLTLVNLGPMYSTVHMYHKTMDLEKTISIKQPQSCKCTYVLRGCMAAGINSRKRGQSRCKRGGSRLNDFNIWTSVAPSLTRGLC